MKAQIKKYLSITKKEWNGLVVLVILIAGVLAAPYIYQLFRKDNTINLKDFDKAVAQLSKVEDQKSYAEGKPDKLQSRALPGFVSDASSGTTITHYS